MLMWWRRRWYLRILSFEEILVLTLFVDLRRTSGIERLHFFEQLRCQIVETANEVHELPGAHIVPRAISPGGHACQADAVLDNPVELAIREALRFRRAHVGRFGVQILPQFGMAAAVVAVAGSAVIG